MVQNGGYSEVSETLYDNYKMCTSIPKKVTPVT